jgi:uncharacterized protein
MRLYPGKIPVIAQDLISKFRDEGDLEVSNVPEAQLDVEAILKEYLRQDRELTEKAKDLMEKRGLPYSQFARTKSQMSEKISFATGDEVIPYLANQILEVFMHSPNVDEVFTDDVELRKKVQTILKKHLHVDDEIDQEVRRRIKNLEEGTAAWEIEYQKKLDEAKRKHKLD